MAKNIADVLVEEPERYVKVRIPRDREDPEDKVVWVNERRFLIRKGEYVEVPESVADILAKEEDMLQVIFDYEERVQR